MAHRFAADLARFGPGRLYSPLAPADAQMYCSRLAQSHYENFSVASVLVPRHLIRHFHNIYAYCRWSDDLADETAGGPKTVKLLDWWRQELLRCYYDGPPRHPVMVALRSTIRSFEIPAEPFLDLLTAFEQDQRVQRYQTFEQLREYCRFSANPVGRLVLHLVDSIDAERRRYSDCICTALQLANFWQDVARDFASGRVYLPEEDRRRFNYPDADLDAQRFTPAFAELMQFEVDRTRDLFYRGFPLTEMAPPSIQSELELFIQGGLSILRKIEAIGYNVWERRPVLTRWEKGLLVGGALWRRLWPALAVW